MAVTEIKLNLSLLPLIKSRVVHISGLNSLCEVYIFSQCLRRFFFSPTAMIRIPESKHLFGDSKLPLCVNVWMNGVCMCVCHLVTCTECIPVLHTITTGVWHPLQA